jgi:hypothetical protein
VSTIEEIIERKSIDSCLEIREYGLKDPSRWPRGTLYPQTLALTSPISGGHSVGIVRSQTQATEFVLLICIYDRLRGLVVRVLGYRSGGPGSIPGTTRFSEKKKPVVGLERGPLSFVSTSEELLDRKLAAPV